MSQPSSSPLHRQIALARRRLVLQTLIYSQACSWSTALGLGVAWLLIQPFAWPEAGSEEMRWGVPLGFLVLGPLAGGMYAWLRAPSMERASLILDERFVLLA